MEMWHLLFSDSHRPSLLGSCRSRNCYRNKDINSSSSPIMQFSRFERRLMYHFRYLDLHENILAVLFYDYSLISSQKNSDFPTRLFIRSLKWKYLLDARWENCSMEVSYKNGSSSSPVNLYTTRGLKSIIITSKMMLLTCTRSYSDITNAVPCLAWKIIVERRETHLTKSIHLKFPTNLTGFSWITYQY